MDFQFLASTPLFRGISAEEIRGMLGCLHAQTKCYEKGAIILRAGDAVQEVGLVLSGGVSIELDDLWGNKTILDRVESGRVFAETYACVPGAVLMVNAVAAEPCEILFVDIGRIVQACSSACAHHAKVIQNLLAISAQKNLNLSRRSLHTASKSIRGRLLSYLSDQVLRQGRRDFYIPFDRQQLADYLNVDRSALSNELGKMRREGLLVFEKNHFTMTGNELDL